MAQAQGGGASVFNSVPGTPRLVPDPGTDFKLPPAGALNYGSIPTLTALMGTVGTATSLVHGDHFEMMNGNEIRTITLDRNHTILGNQVSDVTGNRHDSVDSNYNQHITGTTQRFHNGATNEVFSQQHVHQHATPRQVEEPTSFFSNVNEKLDKFNEEHKSTLHKIEVVISKVDVCATAALGLTGFAFEGKLTSVGVAGVTWDAVGFNAEARALEAKIDGMQDEIDALKGRQSGGQINIQAIFITPFALGIYI